MRLDMFRHVFRHCCQSPQTSAPLTKSSTAWLHTAAWALTQTRTACTRNANQAKKARILFLGSPEFAASVLRYLFEASRQPGALFEVVGVVSRGRVPESSDAQAAGSTPRTLTNSYGSNAPSGSGGVSTTPSSTQTSIPRATRQQIPRHTAGAFHSHPSALYTTHGTAPTTKPECTVSLASMHTAHVSLLSRALPTSARPPDHAVLPALHWRLPTPLPSPLPPPAWPGQLILPATTTCTARRHLSHTQLQLPATHGPTAAISLHTHQNSESQVQPLHQTIHQLAAGAFSHTANSPQDHPKQPRYRHTPVTPVVREALSQGLDPAHILCPTKAKDPAFLDAVSALQPDLCITAAYGALLPQQFLDIPPLGTVNIHPSLLPKYRGPAPVQRCVMDGHTETGVSLVLTVLECDAGPVIAQQAVEVGPEEQAPELTDRLFQIGSQVLLEQLPDLISGVAQARAAAQDHAQASYAPKVSKEEIWLDLTLTAKEAHNKVRALAGWPGTRLRLWVEDKQRCSRSRCSEGKCSTLTSTCDAVQRLMCGAPDAALSPLDIKVMRTRVVYPTQDLHVTLQPQSALKAGYVSLVSGRALVPCGGDTWLELVEVRHSSSLLEDGPATPAASEASVLPAAAQPLAGKAAKRARASRGDSLTGAEFLGGLGRKRLKVSSIRD